MYPSVNNGAVAWKTTGSITVNDLILEGPVQHWIGGVTGRLYGNITIPASRTGSFSAGAAEVDTRIFEVYSTIYGSGNLQVSMGNPTALKQTSLFADNSGFTGRTILQGLGKFGISKEQSLGPNPEAFTADKLEFSGMTLVLTNSLTLDDPNRGFMLNNTLNASSQIYPGGVIEVASQATATVACVISGAGPLTKRGNGMLVLATNDTYTGATTVEAGTVRLSPAWTLASQALTATGATAVVAGEGTLSKLPLQVFQFVFNTNNTMAVPYTVLSASNLTDFADHDFCVTPPWIGELSRTNDVGGGQLLLFTPTLPENIAFKTGAGDFLTRCSSARESSSHDTSSPPSTPRAAASGIGMYTKNLTFWPFALMRGHVLPSIKRRRKEIGAMYSPVTGRPETDPVILLGVTVLQIMMRLPDRACVEAFTYDARGRDARPVADCQGDPV